MPLHILTENDRHGEINQKISELKKRILLVDGQKTAKSAEWQKQNRINRETISALKKEIKELAVECGRLRNPLQHAVLIKEPMCSEVPNTTATPSIAIAVNKMRYAVGAKNIDDALYITDLKFIEQRKQLDLLRDHFKKRKQFFAALVQQYRALTAAKTAKAQNLGEIPPETLEEEANRRLVCQLENDIHRNNVQWMEAEHIRKKYRSIGASLMNDAERFERSLRELEDALNEQQVEIHRLQQMHNEAIEMRDAAKVILQRQEQQAHLSQKTRERQAMDFRRQVEARKMELERIGRKLFVEGKALVHQDSLGSSSGDPSTAKLDPELNESNQLEHMFHEMESLFKQLMEVTGATSSHEVLERFCSQKESTGRLGYLRNAAETEKVQLEMQRESLMQELEASKFADGAETEVNQEVIEKLQLKIANLEAAHHKDIETAKHILQILKYIKERLCEMIYKLQELDESKIELKEKNLTIYAEKLPKFLSENAEDEDYIEILKFKLRQCQELNKQQETPTAEVEHLDVNPEDLLIQLEPPKSPSVPEGEKPQPVPPFYYNLLPGRTQRATGASSSSPEQASMTGVPPDEESEVPTRNYLKRQSVLIVDAKSRRKPFRPMPAGRRK